MRDQYGKMREKSFQNREVLIALCAESTSEYVFSLNGKPLTKDQVDHAFRRAVQRAELEGIHFHTLRHEFGSRLGDMDVNLVKIARLMGHANIRQTRIYVHPTEEGLSDAVEVAVTNRSRIVPQRLHQVS